MTIAFAVDGKAFPLEQDREVRRLLQLSHEDTGTNRMRHAGGHEDRVTSRHRNLVERRQHLDGVLNGDPIAQLLSRHSSAKAEVDGRRGSRRLQHEPRLRLAVSAPEVMGGERLVGMAVNNQPFR